MNYDIWDKARAELAGPSPEEIARRRRLAQQGGEGGEMGMDPQLDRQVEDLGASRQQAQQMPRDTQETPLDRRPDPNWREQTTGPSGRPTPYREGGHPRPAPPPYETGDPSRDAWQRQQNTTGPAEDDPFADAQTRPEEARRILDGARRAGATGDDASIMAIIEGPYGDTPFGRLIARSYYEGKRSRGPR